MNLITLFLISMSYLITASKGESYLIWFIEVLNTAKFRFYCPEWSLFLQYLARGSAEILKYSMRAIMNSSTVTSSSVLNISIVKCGPIIPSSRFKYSLKKDKRSLAF